VRAAEGLVTGWSRTRDASRRAYAAVAVAILLRLAGCGGIAPGGPAPADPSPEDSSTDPSPNETSPTDPASNATVTPDESLADAEFPEGFSRSGVDIATARQRSIAFLRTEPVSGVALERFRPGAYADYQYEANSTQTRFRIDVHNGYVDVTRSDVYVDGTVRYARSARNRQVSFEAGNGSVAETRYRAADSMWAVASRIVTVGDFRAVRTVRDDGERRIRYAVTGVAFRNATDVRGYLIVGEDGVIREARLRYTRAGETKRFEYVIASRSDGDVAPPAWLPAARASGD
jgi:hypothetical protein